MASRLFGNIQRLSGPTRRFLSADSSASAGEHAGGYKTWKLMTFLVAIPGVSVCWINAQIKEKAHHEHYKEHGNPEFIPYEHLRLRTKPFPWGDGNHSLFHTKVNALPEGYEEEEEE